MAFVHNLTNAYVITLFMTESEKVAEQHHNVFQEAKDKHFTWVLWVAVGFNFIVCCFLAHLIWFHV